MGQFDGAEAIDALGFGRLSQRESRYGNFDAPFWASQYIADFAGLGLLSLESQNLPH